jgi:hypothetical protein
MKNEVAALKHGDDPFALSLWQGDPPDRFTDADGLCCTNPMRDSSRDSSVVAGRMSKPTPPFHKTKNWPAYSEPLMRHWFEQPPAVRR